MTSFDSSAERLFKKLLQGTLGIYLILGVALTLVHLPSSINEDMRGMPERVARLMLEAPKPKPVQPPAQEPTEMKGSKSSQELSKEPKKQNPSSSKPSNEKVREMVKKTGLLAALIQEEKNGGLESIVQDRHMNQVLSDSRLISAESSKPSRQTFQALKPSTPGLSDQKLREAANAARGEGAQLANKEATLLPGTSGHGGSSRGGNSTQSLGQGGAFRVKGGASGNIDYDAIARVVEQYKGGLIYLYNKELRKIPTLKGTVTVEFSIDSTGKVVEAHVVSSTMEYSPLEEALTSRILYWKFPKLHDSLIVVTYPFVFFPV